MLTTFTLLVVTGGVLRLALGWGLHRRYQLDLSVPQALAGVLVMLAGLPDVLTLKNVYLTHLGQYLRYNFNCLQIFT